MTKGIKSVEINYASIDFLNVNSHWNQKYISIVNSNVGNIAYLRNYTYHVGNLPLAVETGRYTRPVTPLCYGALSMGMDSKIPVFVYSGN